MQGPLSDFEAYFNAGGAVRCVKGASNAGTVLVAYRGNPFWEFRLAWAADVGRRVSASAMIPDDESPYDRARSCGWNSDTHVYEECETPEVMKEPRQLRSAG